MHPALVPISGRSFRFVTMSTDPVIVGHCAAMRARTPVRMVPLLTGALLLAAVASGSVRAAGAAPLVAGRPAPATAGAGLVNNPCKQSAYTFDGSKWGRTLHWYFSAR